MRKILAVSFIKRHLLKSGEFAGNVLTMLTGNLSGQLIAILASPIVARLYSAEDFGKMTYVFSIVGITSVLSCFRYESAIVLPKEDAKSFNIFLLCVIIALFFSGLVLLVVLFYGASFTQVLGKPWLVPWLYFVPAGILIWGILNSMTFLFTRLKRFMDLSVGRIIVALGTASTKIIAGFIAGSTTFWLLTGNFVGPLTLIIFLAIKLGIRKLKTIFSEASLKKLVSVAKEYKNFPLFSMPTEFINSMSQNLPVLLLAQFFRPEIIGFFGLANSTLRRPIALMGQSFSKVYLQKAAELHFKDESLRSSFLKTTIVLAAIGILPFALLAVGGSWMFHIVFGDKWTTAGFYAQLLSPWLFFGFINTPATQVIIVKQALKFNLIYNIILLFARIASIVGGYFIAPRPSLVIALFSGCGVLANMFYISYAWHLTKDR